MEKHAKEAGLSEEIAEQFKIAVDEACTNVIKHAYRGAPEQRIDVAVMVGADRVTVRIRDEGTAFRPEFYTTPDILESIKQRRAGGYGVLIMTRLMDQVEYRTRGNVNEVYLTKYRTEAADLDGNTGR